jgi:hypothetical protein
LRTGGSSRRCVPFVLSPLHSLRGAMLVQPLALLYLPDSLREGGYRLAARHAQCSSSPSHALSLLLLILPLLIILPLQQMEKFKACEKEMKTKAFSKEGLIQSAKLDPKAQEKLEQTQWLQTCVEELLLQVETAEAEIETLQQGGRKKGKVGATAQDRLEELERLNERRKWHISRLEIMLRLLDNGTLSTEQVQGLKDDVNYFVEDNAVRHTLISCEPGTTSLRVWKQNDDYDEDEGMYDDLNLDEEEEKFGRLVTEDHDSDGSDDASESVLFLHSPCVTLKPSAPAADLPSRTPPKSMTRKAWRVASARTAVQY